MRLLILGANGRTGQLATSEALKHECAVTALVRRPSSMNAQEGLTIVEGSPVNESDVQKAFSATPQDPIQAVLITLNASRESDSPFSKPVSPPNLIRDSVRNTTAVMRKHNTKKIIIMSANGVGNSFQELPWAIKWLFRYSNMSYQMDDHNVVDREIRGFEDLDWALVRPAVLKGGDGAPVKEFGEQGKGVGLFHGITRASVAAFMIDLVEQGNWSKSAVVIAN